MKNIGQKMYYVNEFDQNHLFKMNLDGRQQEKVLDESVRGFYIQVNVFTILVVKMVA